MKFSLPPTVAARERASLLAEHVHLLGPSSDISLLKIAERYGRLHESAPETLQRLVALEAILEAEGNQALASRLLRSGKPWLYQWLRRARLRLRAKAPRCSRSSPSATRS